MIKMDMIWIATAKLIYPNTYSSKLVSLGSIEQGVSRIFNARITPIMVDKHLVSWEDRQADKAIPARGGSRNRYLFKTEDGISPSGNGDFRLYKDKDGKHDGKDKTGRTRPELGDIPQEYHYLIEWYDDKYRTG